LSFGKEKQTLDASYKLGENSML